MGLPRIGEDIAAGHAFDKHVLTAGEYPEINTRAESQTTSTTWLQTGHTVR